MGTSIHKCVCPNQYQDHKYGEGNRVWNDTAKGRRCTSCAKEHIGGGNDGKKKK